MKRRRRSGFSLLEVLLSTAILLGSVVVLSHISFVGMAHMDAAEQYASAQLVCQTRMNEILAGAAPIEEVSGQAIPELPGWGLTVKVESAGQPGLLAVEVTAAEQPAEAAFDAAGEAAGGTVAVDQETEGAGKRFTLVRWINDPEQSQPSVPSTGGDSPPAVEGPAEPPLFDETTLPSDFVLPELPEGPVAPEPPMLPEEPGPLDIMTPEF